jgi:hypothetical protein
MVMTFTKQSFLRELLKTIETGLLSLRLRKERRRFVCGLGDGALGVVGLNVTTHRGDGCIGFVPIVGVRYEPIEAKLEAWSKEGRPVGTTIQIPVGYVTPEKRFLEWLFEPGSSDNDAEIARMVRAIRDYGLPFMKSHSTLEALTDALEASNFTNKQMRSYQLPIAYLLQGKTDEALSMISQELAGLGPRNDAAAQNYKSFAENFREAVSVGAVRT